MNSELTKDMIRFSETVYRNLFYYPSDQLYDYARSKRLFEDRIQCVAELFVREFLKKGSAEKEIDDVLPNKELEEFWRRAGEDFLDIQDKSGLFLAPFWTSSEDFSYHCEIAVRKRLETLCVETDGFIPVYRDASAFFIPFHFEETASETIDIVDLVCRPIPRWQAPYRRLVQVIARLFPDIPLKCRCVVHCDQSGLPVLKENSLMLPLFLAYLKKKERIKYNHLRLVATGEIEDDVLKAVKTKEKAEAFHKVFPPDSCFFFPEKKGYRPVGRWEIPLPIIAARDLPDYLQRLVEAKGLFVPNYLDALERLEALTRERDSEYKNWGMMLALLDNSMNAIPDYLDEQNYLLCLMLKNSILCHMGRTAEALTLNRKAQKFAREHNRIRELLRLQIEQLVEWQDEEDFIAIAGTAKTLGKEIGKIRDADLLMRYCGTMGQAHSFGDLADEPGFSRQEAKRFFTKALDYASRKLKECAAIKLQQDEADNDIAQDLNYIVLWYALFDPESPAAQEAYSNAEKRIRNLRKGKKKNRRYLIQLKGLSFYRYLLREKKVPGVKEDSFRLAGEYEEDWVAALSGKYVGAVKAAKGKKEKAEEIFEEYSRILDGSKSPILQFIQVTILSEAFRSLGDESYRDRALCLAEGLRLAYPKSVPPWIAYLRGEGEFPGLKYWR